MKKILTLLFLIASTNLFAQTGILKGKIIHDDTKLAYNEVSVMLKTVKMITTTNALGEFQFSGIPFGTYEMVISADGVTEELINVTVNSAVTNVDIIQLKSATTNTSNYNSDNSAISAEDASSQDEGVESSSSQNVSSVLNASRDAFLSAATFGWGQYFYKMRGYENDHNLLYMNGVPMNDLEEGGVFYNSWSGLNDVFRGRTQTLGLGINEYNFGGFGLNTSLDATASNQRKGTRLTYTSTNRSYRNRLMLTHSSGLQKNGWAYSFSVSRRWANQGQIKGTYYNAYGYFAAIEKRFKNQGISLMLVGAPIERGKAGPATMESFNLAGTKYYNPYWGYQDGKIRNSRVLKTHSPMLILTHDAQLNNKTQLTTAIALQSGETSTSTIDWYNATDPRPDYYRYLPSFDSSVVLTNELTNYIQANPNYMQMDWDGFYEANRLNKSFSDRAVYILSADVEAIKKLNIGVNLKSELNDHITLFSGLTYQKQINHNFKRVEDLLGGGYWENINQFAEDGIQGQIVSTALNLDDETIVRKKGESYGYDYNINFSKASWFAQGVFVYNKFDFFLASELGYTSFYRNGNYRHGLYPNDSKGHSSTLTFFNHRFKGGITYKINGRNYVYANGSFGNRAPYVDNVFIAPRLRNSIIDNPTNEKVNSGEIGYLLRSPNVKARVTFFATEVKNVSDIKRYFGDFGASFTNNVLQGVNKRYTGIELGADVKLSPSFSLNLAASFSQAFYTTRATSKLYSDNDAAIGITTGSSEQILYIKDYYLPVGPQSTFQAALNYRSKRYWFANLAINYLANNWIDFAPDARTSDAVDLIPYESQEWHTILDQKKLPSFYTVDISGGKSFKVNKYIPRASNSTFLNLNIGISNVLNNKNIQLYGFENLRLGGAKVQPDWFVPKQAYALGIQYFLNLALRF